MATPDPTTLLALAARAEATETTSCGYQGYEFGAGYLDSLCCDGFLWDADSCDEPGGGLTHGGEIPCPRCNTIAFLEDAQREAADGSCGQSMMTPWCAAVIWERDVSKALNENRSVTETWLAQLAPFTTCDWPDRQAVYEGHAPWDAVVDRQWPWEIAHDR